MKRWICAVLTIALLTGLAIPKIHAEEHEEFHGYLVSVPEFRLQAASEIDADMTYVRDNLYYVENMSDVETMRDAGLVDYFEPNYAMYLMDLQWNMDIVNAEIAWQHKNQDDNYDRRGTGVTIAVIDSGVKSDNSDFIAEHILPYYDLYNNTDGVDIWHGTFVAGLIAAQVDNQIGIDGAASDAMILPICITKEGKSDVVTAIQAIDYAVAHGADVINLSIGGTKSTRALQRACNDAINAGVIVVAAAGNYQEGESTSEKNYVYPAGYDNVISVSGITNTVEGPKFDSAYSYYNDKVNVCAPGTNIKSLYLNLGVASASGTSFATPLVSSMAAIAKQANPNIDQGTFLSLLTATSTDLGSPGYDIYYGSGLVNFEAFCDALEEEYPIYYYSGTEAAVFEGEVKRTYTVCDSDITLPEPIRSGYHFLGWYDNPSLSGKSVTTIPSASIGERKFYASWEKNANKAPVITSSAMNQVTATPGSRDGKTLAISFTADIKDWFSDPDGDALTYQLTNGPGTLNGTTYSFTPISNDAEKDYSVSLQATDSHGAISPTHTLAIHVNSIPNSAPTVTNDVPIAMHAAPASRDGKTPAISISFDISSWFTDCDNDDLSYQIVDGPGVLSGTNYSFTPETTDAGNEYSILLQANDTTSSIQYRFSILVDAIPNSSPAITGIHPSEIFVTPASADGMIPSTSFTVDLSEWFSDPDGDSLSYHLFESPGTLQGTKLIYTPTSSDVGNDYLLQVQATDSNHSSSPILSIPIHVTAKPNSLPVISDYAVSSVLVAPASRDGKIAAKPFIADIRNWFTDPDGDPLTYHILEGPASLDGSILTYLPDADDAGKEITVKLVAKDTQLGESPAHIITFNVSSIPNSAPIITDTTDTIPEKIYVSPASVDGITPAVSFSSDISEWFSDPDGDQLTYILDGVGNLSGTTVTFTPQISDAGKDYSLVIKASDSYGLESPEITLHIYVADSPNCAPAISSSAPSTVQASPASMDGKTPAFSFVADIRTWFSDPDDNDLQYYLLEGPGNLDGSVYTYTPVWEEADSVQTILLQAEDSSHARSPILNLQISVRSIPASQSTLVDTDPVTMYLCALPVEVNYEINLFDNLITDVKLNDVQLNWHIENNSLNIEIPKDLSEGTKNLVVSFDACEDINTSWIILSCPSSSFTDISNTAWYHSSVDFVVNAELMQGVGDNRFAPNNSFTRAMLVTVLYRMAGQPETDAELPFADVPQGTWYSTPVAWAANNGLVNGVAPGKFSPNSPVTREQLVTILFRYCGDDGQRSGLDQFPDAATVSPYAREAMDWAIAHNIISGIASNESITLSPRSSATRAQVATILMRFCAITNL